MNKLACEQIDLFKTKKNGDKRNLFYGVIYYFIMKCKIRFKKKLVEMNCDMKQINHELVDMSTKSF